ncbi:MAG: M23 family metallopeptidase [Bacteroidota bacterium]
MNTTISKSITLTSFASFLFLIFGGLNTISAQYGLANVENDTLTKSVLIHPVIETGKNEGIYSSEHTHKSKLRLGDQLARDFTLSVMQDDGMSKRYKNEGKENEDWYGWREDVLAPFDGTVTRVQHPDTINTPGTMNREADPGLIFFQNDNGVTVIYAHAREIEVEKGQQVKVGEVVAKVGNNGNSRLPHIHVGAWKDDTPLQIQLDLYAEQRYKK